jgi:hypothetical protein
MVGAWVIGRRYDSPGLIRSVAGSGGVELE